ncbi:hypothetical protein D3C87_1295820 [compost metagenome]
MVTRSLSAKKSSYFGSGLFKYFHQGKSGPPVQGHFSMYKVLDPIFLTESSMLFLNVSTAEKTPIIVKIPIVTPNKDNNVRVRLSFNADNANFALSFMRPITSIFRF